MRRRFSFALLPVLDVGRQLPDARCRTPAAGARCAGRQLPDARCRDQLPDARCRDGDPPDARCRDGDPPAAPRGPPSAARPMSLGAPAYRVIPASSRHQKSPPAGHGRRALWPTAWAMFQTNNTPVFPISPNCPIIPRKVAYIFVRGPYDQTRRPVGRGA
jgi:hypothetical protein